MLPQRNFQAFISTRSFDSILLLIPGIFILGALGGRLGASRRHTSSDTTKISCILGAQVALLMCPKYSLWLQQPTFFSQGSPFCCLHLRCPRLFKQPSGCNTHIQGYEFEAEFLRTNGEFVELQDPQGRKKWFPISNFIQDDKDFIKEQVATSPVSTQ